MRTSCFCFLFTSVLMNFRGEGQNSSVRTLGNFLKFKRVAIYSYSSCMSAFLVELGVCVYIKPSFNLNFISITMRFKVSVWRIYSLS